MIDRKYRKYEILSVYIKRFIRTSFFIFPIRYSRFSWTTSKRIICTLESLILFLKILSQYWSTKISINGLLFLDRSQYFPLFVWCAKKFLIWNGTFAILLKIRIYAREVGIMKLQQKLHPLLFAVLLKRVVSVVRTLSILETSNVLRHYMALVCEQRVLFTNFSIHSYLFDKLKSKQNVVCNKCIQYLNKLIQF